MDDSSSDVSDQEYVPEGLVEELSEEDTDDEVGEEDQNTSKKRSGTKKKKSPRKKMKLDEELNKDDENDEEEKSTEKNQLTEHDEKKKADSLWADFLKDTNTKPKSQQVNKSVESKKIESPIEKKEEKKVEDKKPEEKKMTVTQIFEFAGEEVRVEKQVPTNSVEAKLSTGRGGLTTRGRSARGGSSGAGLSSILSQIGKKQKISTLEKSKLDWDRFKKDEKIEDELESHKKGKNGYLERQDFLERADLRQFEIEKELRAKTRPQRL